MPALLFSLLLLLSGCAPAAETPVSSVSAAPTLTLDEVRALAEKGDALTLEDLDGYLCTDVGSGLYVYRYPIDDTYELLVSTGSPDEKPLRVLLQSADGESIDIREDGLDAFLGA